MKKEKKIIKQTSNKIDALDSVILSEEKIRKLVLKATSKEIIKLFPVAKHVLGVTSAIDQAIREEKVANFLNELKTQYDTLEEAQASIINLHKSREGLILYHKMVQILDNEIVDEEWIKLLAKALRYISNTNIEEQFTMHSYVLTQIDELSSQGLLLLSRYDVWRTIKFEGGTSMSKETIVGDKYDQLAQLFCNKMNMSDIDTRERVKHAFNDLESKGMFKLTKNKGVQLPPVGSEVLKYITYE